MYSRRQMYLIEYTTNNENGWLLKRIQFEFNEKSMYLKNNT